MELAITLNVYNGFLSDLAQTFFIKGDTKNGMTLTLNQSKRQTIQGQMLKNDPKYGVDLIFTLIFRRR